MDTSGEGEKKKKRFRTSIDSDDEDEGTKEGKAEETQEEADERARRFILQTPGNNGTRPKFETLPLQYPWMLAVNSNGPIRNLIQEQMYRRYALHLSLRGESQETEGVRWRRAFGAEEQGRIAFAGLIGQFTGTHMGRSSWTDFKSDTVDLDANKLNDFLYSFEETCVLATSILHRGHEDSKDFIDRLKNPPLVRRQIEASTCWDIIRDLPDTFAMHAIVVDGKSWARTDNILEQIADGRLSEETSRPQDAKQVTDKTSEFEAAIQSAPTKRVYILELIDSEGKDASWYEAVGFKQGPHLSAFMEDMISMCPKLQALAITRNKMFPAQWSLLPLSTWMKAALARAPIPCKLQPSPDLVLEWPWSGKDVLRRRYDEKEAKAKANLDTSKDILREWPVEYTLFKNENIGFNPIATIEAIQAKIQARWNENDAIEKKTQKNYVSKLKWHTRWMLPITAFEIAPFWAKPTSEHDNRALFELYRDPRQADAYARFMHFPEQSEQFHIVFQFGFENWNEDSPNYIGNLTHKFHPEILQPPNPAIALYRKLEKQGQLMIVRVITHQNKRDAQPQYAGDTTAFGMRKTEYVILREDGSVPDACAAYESICARITRAQQEKRDAALLLNALTVRRPDVGFQSLKPLIQSFLGGKFCHSPDCKKESTVQCGHCDKAGYCSQDCAGKHWAKHYQQHRS